MATTRTLNLNSELISRARLAMGTDTKIDAIGAAVEKYLDRVVVSLKEAGIGSGDQLRMGTHMIHTKHWDMLVAASDGLDMSVSGLMRCCLELAARELPMADPKPLVEEGDGFFSGIMIGGTEYAAKYDDSGALVAAEVRTANGAFPVPLRYKKVYKELRKMGKHLRKPKEH